MRLQTLSQGDEFYIFSQSAGFATFVGSENKDIGNGIKEVFHYSATPPATPPNVDSD